MSENYQIKVFKNKRFKSNLVRIIFRRPLKKESITIANFLNDFLTYSTRKYPTKRDLILKTQELYSANIYAYNERIGNYLTTNFILETLNDEYTEKGIFSASIDLFHDVIMNPVIENGEFHQGIFNIIYHKYEASLLSIKENTKYYSTIRALESLDDNAVFSYRECGYLEDLKLITPKSLYEYYLSLLKESTIDIYVVGNIDEKQAENLIREKFTTLKSLNEKPLILAPKLQVKNEIDGVKEIINANQSKLVVAAYIGELDLPNYRYALTIFNTIFGKGPDSKLFMNIREKSSLAYYINSTFKILDKVLLIKSGISKENAMPTFNLIARELLAMQKGEFTTDDINKAAKLYISGIEETEDSIEDITNAYYAMDLLNLDDLKTRKSRILQVKKEEVVTIARSIELQLLYILEGDK